MNPSSNTPEYLLLFPIDEEIDLHQCCLIDSLSDLANIDVSPLASLHKIAWCGNMHPCSCSEVYEQLNQTVPVYRLAELVDYVSKHTTDMDFLMDILEELDCSIYITQDSESNPIYVIAYNENLF